jgi:hypothetical protein
VPLYGDGRSGTFSATVTQYGGYQTEATPSTPTPVDPPRRLTGAVAPGTLATETFPGASGAAWSAQWTTGVANGAVVNQDGAGHGTLTSSAVAYGFANFAYLSGITAVRDLDITFDAVFPVIAEQYLIVELRTTQPTTSGGASDSYYIQIDPSRAAGTSIDVGKTVGGVNTDLTVFSFGPAWTANVTQRVRFQVVGDTIQVKWWTPGGTEPSTWGGSLTDTSLTAATGKVAFQIITGAVATARTARVSNITVTDGGTGAGGGTPAAASGAITLSGTGTTTGAATAAGTITLTGTGASTATGAASGTITLAGTGTAKGNAAAAGTVTLTGAGSSVGNADRRRFRHPRRHGHGQGQRGGRGCHRPGRHRRRNRSRCGQRHDHARSDCSRLAVAHSPRRHGVSVRRELRRGHRHAQRHRGCRRSGDRGRGDHPRRHRDRHPARQSGRGLDHPGRHCQRLRARHCDRQRHTHRHRRASGPGSAAAGSITLGGSGTAAPRPAPVAASPWRPRSRCPRSPMRLARSPSPGSPPPPRRPQPPRRAVSRSPARPPVSAPPSPRPGPTRRCPSRPRPGCTSSLPSPRRGRPGGEPGGAGVF